MNWPDLIDQLSLRLQLERFCLQFFGEFCKDFIFIPFQCMVFHLKASVCVLGKRTVRIRTCWISFLLLHCQGQNNVCKASLFYQPLLLFKRTVRLKMKMQWLSTFCMSGEIPLKKVGPIKQGVYTHDSNSLSQATEVNRTTFPQAHKGVKYPSNYCNSLCSIIQELCVQIITKVYLLLSRC